MQLIELDRKKGPVVFLGGINAMPMMYAIELRKQGVEVLYFVDRPEKDTLSRPENHFKDIKYPYPDWIIETILVSQIFLPLFPRYFAYWIKKYILKCTSKSPQVYILNGFFCSLAPYLDVDTPKIFLPGGSELDSWADIECSDALGQSFRDKSIFKYIPANVSKRIIKRIVRRQFSGALACSKVIYFPKGFNNAGDRVLKKLEEKNVHILSRYDISFEPLKYENRGVISNEDKMIIFSGVRFSFKTFPDGNDGYNKGNDIIIKGLSEYYRINKNIEIHFVEKGQDVAEAKKLCAELGLTDAIIWHKEMKFTDLLALYQKADVCFDQVGEHWIGAIGFYALWLGKPLIANDRRAVEAGVWGEDAPILSAHTAEQIKIHLIAMERSERRSKISRQAMQFAETTLGPEMVLRDLFVFTAVDTLF